MAFNNDLCGDSLAALLSLPVNFTVDPSLTVKEISPAEALSPTTSSSSTASADAITEVTLKKTRQSLEGKDQKTKDRILRNRAAAQESRDKKRRYVTDLESTNKQLREENERMTKRAKTLECEKELLSAQLEDVRRQLAESQANAKTHYTAKVPVIHRFCDSARIAKRNVAVC